MYPSKLAVVGKIAPVDDAEDNIPIRISEISSSWNSHYLEHPADAYNFEIAGERNLVDAASRCSVDLSGYRVNAQKLY